MQVRHQKFHLTSNCTYKHNATLTAAIDVPKTVLCASNYTAELVLAGKASNNAFESKDSQPQRSRASSKGTHALELLTLNNLRLQRR